jgi:hypothetical protein
MGGCFVLKALDFESSMQVSAAENYLTSLLTMRCFGLSKDEGLLTNAQLMLSRSYTQAGIADAALPGDVRDKGRVLTNEFESSVNNLLLQKLDTPEPKPAGRIRQALHHLQLCIAHS